MMAMASPLAQRNPMDPTLAVPTLNLETFDLDELVDRAWDWLVERGRQPKDRESWELGYRMAISGILQPFVEKWIEYEEDPSRS